MNPLLSLLALSSAAGFKAETLAERYLQEAKVSSLGTFALHRYALIPALIWSVIFVRVSDINQILNSPKLVIYLILIALTWNAQAFLTSCVLNTVSSMSGLSTLQYLLTFPLFLLVGIVFNQDIPNFFSIAAIASLCCALLIQPAHHEKNTRARYSLPLAAIAGLVVLQASLAAVSDGLYREALQEIRPEVLIGIFSTLTISFCVIWIGLLYRNRQDTKALRKRPFVAAGVPLFWFAASIPEAYAFAALPIYTVLSISAVTFAMDTLSDLFHRRIHLNLQTLGFITLVLVGVGLAAYSI